MSHDLHTYGEYDVDGRIFFKLTLNGVGVTPTLASNDIMLTLDGNTPLDITGEVSPVSGMTGVFYWTPDNPARTQCEIMIINIKDFSGHGDFDENCLIISTGGHANARFSVSG